MVLIVEPAKLGDFIQSTPLLVDLAKRHKKLTLAVTQASVAEAARLSGLVNEIITISDEELKNGGILTDKPEAIYNLSIDPQALKYVKSLEVQDTYGPHLNGDKLHLSLAQNLTMAIMALNRRLGQFNLVDIWRHLSPRPDQVPKKLFWPKPEPSLEDKLPTSKKLIGLQLGCGHHLRRWPVEHFVRLCLLLDQPDFVPILLGSRRERSLALRFLELYRKENKDREVLDLTGQTDLLDLGQILDKLDLLISADTGVMHMGAAMETPLLGIFCGPALATETGPYGSGNLIIQSLAPCGPCKEPGCDRPSCQAIPGPEIVCQLAMILLTGQLQKINIPEHLRLWKSELDDFGQKLLPLFPKILSQEEQLALIIREAGRSIIKTGYNTGFNDEELSLYLPGPAPEHLVASLKFLAKRAFNQPQDRELFVENGCKMGKLLNRLN